VVYHLIIGDSANQTQIQNVMDCVEPEKCAYPVDGLIIEHDDLEYGKSLGVTGHHENRLLAFKWADETHETTFLGLEVATTRTGMISLTGMFDDVVIDGTVVNRAYLHNVNIFESLKLGIGDKVTLYKANQIIPQVAENLTKSGTLELPKVCPCCETPAEMRTSLQGTRLLYCSNKECPAKIVQMFNHFCSKTRMNIEGMSGKTLDKLIGAGFIKTFGDLFCLEHHAVSIARMPGFGPGKVKNLVEAAEKARHCKLNQFLAGLGVHTVGRTASRTISQYFRGDWNAFEQAVQDGFDFTQLDDFGEIMHNNICAWYADKEREKLWRPALQYIEFENDKENAIMTENNTFTGKTVVATGKLENFTRDGIQMKLLSLGAKPGSSVSSKTDFLIVGEGAGSKLAKAQQHGVKTLTEREFLSMLPDGDPDFMAG
jgi:DNA ligase (NAD+)